jgi:methionine aminopeptidase
LLPERVDTNVDAAGTSAHATGAVAAEESYNDRMSIQSQSQLDKLRIIGRIVRLALNATAAAVRPGMTTRELDEICNRVLTEHGAESAPPKVYGFPGAICISVNDEAIHGIPGDRAIQPGDLVKLDLVAEKGGYFADAAVTVASRRRERDCAAIEAVRGERILRSGEDGSRRQSSLRYRPRRGAGDHPLRI